MVRGPDDSSDADDGRVLSPDELDITDDEHVAEIDEGRYVVSPNDPIGDVGSQAESTPPAEPTSEPDPEPADDPVELTETDVHEWLEGQFDDSGSRYGFDVTAKFDGTVRQRQMVSNDVVTIFESLVLWYAQQIDNQTPVEEVLGILLREANVPIRYPAASLKQMVETTDLSPDDSIADLLRAVDEDGFRL
jgi:hypothetical protein